MNDEALVIIASYYWRPHELYVWVTNDGFHIYRYGKLNGVRATRSWWKRPWNSKSITSDQFTSKIQKRFFMPEKRNSDFFSMQISFCVERMISFCSTSSGSYSVVFGNVSRLIRQIHKKTSNVKLMNQSITTTTFSQILSTDEANWHAGYMTSDHS